jgi:sigma-B regulation protein RsbU (phosphoserine phosphatase)
MKDEEQNKLIQELFLLQRVAQRINSNLDLDAMVYALLDPKKRIIVFANAGHLRPLLVDSLGTHFLDTDSGLPLGIQDGSYSERTVEMASGNRLVLYSDGVTEAMNSSRQRYGELRLRDHIAKPSATVQSLLDDVRSFTAGQPTSDNVTVVMIETR